MDLRCHEFLPAISYMLYLCLYFPCYVFILKLIVSKQEY